VRDGLPPLAAGLGAQTTERMSRDTGATRVAPVPPATRPRPRRRGLLPLAAVLAGLLLLGGLAWALSSGLPNQDSPGVARVGVPDLTGLSQEGAQGRLEEAGLRLGSRDEAASSEAPEGEVVAQTPQAGSEAERGSAVDIVISTGPVPASTTPPSTSTATSSATSSASASSTASPSEATAPPQEGADEAAKQAEEAAKELEKAREEARKVAEERQEERQKAREERRGKD
jgi:beta-lactam-binding protein with PASTA domain